MSFKRTIDSHFKNVLRVVLSSVIIFSLALTASAQKDGDYRSVGSGGWSNAPGANATAAITNGKVTKITVKGSSSGYAAVPTVTITGGNGSGAAAIAVLTNGRVTAIKVTNGGSGYTSAPAVTFTGVNQPVSIWQRFRPAYSTTWKIKSQDSLGADSIKMRSPGYDASGWLNAVVPGTIYESYVADSLQTHEKAPEYGSNIDNANHTIYTDRFWYRTEFNVPAAYAGKKIWLNIMALNKIGEIYLNNTKLAGLNGFREPGRYDVSQMVNKTGRNVLAIVIDRMKGDSLNDWEEPTYLAGNGWDWMPPVPGFNRGLTDKIFLSASAAVIVRDPYMQTMSLGANNTSATLNLSAQFVNTSDTAQNGQVTVLINPGNIKLVTSVPIGPKATANFNTGNFVMNNPRLWWPNGYGEPNLYNCKIIYSIKGQVSDSTSFNFGVRKFSYANDKYGVLNISCNGKRIFVRGGCWGMSDFMLRVHGKDYEPRIRFHKEMGMNMIRNWTGCETDDEFYDYCDKYGIMLWDEFFQSGFFNFTLDQTAYLKNVVYKLKRERNHAAVAIWCGVNEGISVYDQSPMMIRDSVIKYDMRQRLYQSCSNSGNTADNTQFGMQYQGGISSDGPYYDQSIAAYFTKTANPPGSHGFLTQEIYAGNYGFHPELGAACFPASESFRLFMPAANIWPRNDVWNFNHFFDDDGSIGRGNGASPSSYVNLINSKYGNTTDIEDFCKKAQLLNIETHRAMYEGYSDHMWGDASGLLMWMSQSAFPTMIWQTYDYYLDCTGGYWGVKKACEPLHIQWSIASDSVKVINATATDYNNLKAIFNVYNMDGSIADSYSDTVTVNSKNDTSAYCFQGLSGQNLALRHPSVASSNYVKNSSYAFDGNLTTRWGSTYDDNEWIYVDLGSEQKVGAVTINWETAYGQAYKIQVSDDAQNWTDVYSTTTGKGGVDNITFPQVTTRYVRMLGIKRGTIFGYSIYEFQVFEKPQEALSQVYFLRMRLQDASGKLLSENFYWHNATENYAPLLTMPVVLLQQTSSTTQLPNGNTLMTVNLTNPATSAGMAFDVHVQLKNTDGSRVLPVFMNDNYFSIMKGETKTVTIEYNQANVKGGSPQLLVEQYNSRD